MGKDIHVAYRLKLYVDGNATEVGTIIDKHLNDIVDFIQEKIQRTGRGLLLIDCSYNKDTKNDK